MLYSLFAILLSAAVIKIIRLKKAAREITAAFADRLQTDTNTLIDISSRDRDMRALAGSINTQLRILRQEHLRYHQGDTELKNAVTNISHDLRTPLTAICGYLYMIRKTDDSAQIHRYLDFIEERTDAMKQLTEELFRYSVIQSGEPDEPAEEICLNQMLEDSIMGYFGAFSEKGIVPAVEITETKVIRHLHRADVSRIFSNLLNNALKYSDGDLTITMTDAGTITFSNMASALSPVEVNRLFDRFYTVEAARNSTGLGLSIVRTLTERLGGSVTADYKEGRLTLTVQL
ncbi:MAG: HAMP domain-containing histidine kinase [Oscillospiraceae bacterium]|nr:HAMP domain-containing histidine kinase [Oscillospiraceae bacterium]